MNRKEVYRGIEETMGLVLTFLKELPDSSLKLECQLMKRVQMEPGPVPNKYREFTGVGIAAATKYRYCSFSTSKWPS